MKISRSIGRIIMAYYNPQLLHTMRAALDGVMTQVPMSHATPGIKAHWLKSSCRLPRRA